MKSPRRRKKYADKNSRKNTKVRDREKMKEPSEKFD